MIFTLEKASSSIFLFYRKYLILSFSPSFIPPFVHPVISPSECGGGGPGGVGYRGWGLLTNSMDMT